MNLYPAIDLFEGKVVRLERGDFARSTVYSDSPEDMARKWADQGAAWIHVVDLEGARSGKPANLDAIRKIRKAVDCSIEMGGGLRDAESVQKILETGIDRAVIGTKALDEGFLKQVLQSHGPAIAVGLDVRDGRVRLEGWLTEGGKTLEEALGWLNNFSLETLIYTDIQKDGMLEGPSLDSFRQVLEQTRSRVILSGGIGKIEDIQKAASIQHPRFEGIIVGKALYENRFTVRQALDCMNPSKELS